MKLIEYINQLYPGDEYESLRLKILEKLPAANLGENTIIPQVIEVVISALDKGTELTKTQHDSFVREMARIKSQNKVTYDFYVMLLKKQSEDVYFTENGSDIHKLAEFIDKDDSDPIKVAAILESKENNPMKNKRFLRMLNAYLVLLNIESDITRHATRYGICFFLNCIRIIIIRSQKEKPDFGKYCGLDLNAAFYPLPLSSSPRLPIEPGTKDADAYFPYKLTHKVFQDDKGFISFVVIDARGKRLFVQDTYGLPLDCRADAVFASKIAITVSKKHFASMRLLSNGFAASKKLEAYERPIKDAKHDYLWEAIESGATFEGVGIVDEVLRFIGEQDGNSENFGLQKVPNSNQIRVCKIDYDRCDLEKESAACLSRKGNGALVNPAEEAYARLKLALYSPEFLAALASKIYKHDFAKRDKRVKECVIKADKKLELFCADDKQMGLLRTEQIKVEPIFQELKAYVEMKWRSNTRVRRTIIQGLEKRKNHVLQKLGGLTKSEVLQQAMHPSPIGWVAAESKNGFSYRKIPEELTPSSQSAQCCSCSIQ